MTVITETDLVGAARSGYYLARQPDNKRMRTWEIPGTAHADNYTIKVSFIDSGFAPLDQLVAAYAPTNTLMGQELAHFINFAPQHHYVLQAAIAGLHGWGRTGTPPPSAPRIEIGEGDPPPLILDTNGLAKGGVRTPWVDVPIAAQRASAAARASCLICSGPVSRSMPPPSAGSIRVGRAKTSNVSQNRSTRRSGRDTCCGRIGRKYSSSPRRPILAVNDRSGDHHRQGVPAARGGCR